MVKPKGNYNGDYSIGALIALIRMGFWGPLAINRIRNPKKSIGDLFRPLYYTTPY